MKTVSWLSRQKWDCGPTLESQLAWDGMVRDPRLKKAQWPHADFFANLMWGFVKLLAPVVLWALLLNLAVHVHAVVLERLFALKHFKPNSDVYLSPPWLGSIVARNQGLPEHSQFSSWSTVCQLVSVHSPRRIGSPSCSSSGPLPS